MGAPGGGSGEGTIEAFHMGFHMVDMHLLPSNTGSSPRCAETRAMSMAEAAEQASTGKSDLFLGGVRIVPARRDYNRCPKVP